MLSPNYTDAGAGVAVSGNTVYFTLDVGGGGGGGDSSGSGVSQGPPDVTIFPQFTPVDTATPQPDGSIIHTVQDGQAFWNIAAIYGITTDELLEINNLTENTILFPGDKLVVKPPNDTPTPTLEATVTPFPATATSTPSSTPTPLSELEVFATETAQAELMATLTPAPAFFENVMSSGRQALLVLIGTLVIGGLALVIVGSVMNLRK
jgi:LysM repeat protein